MKYNNCEFHVGDEVETVDGMTGKIVLICDCEKCAERGFFEPKWETSDGKYSDYITVNQANWDFPYYRRIGKYVWNHDANEERSTKNIFKKGNTKMKEIKLTIDGKEVQLTEEQLRMLGFKTKPNPFDRTNNPCGEYFYTDAFGSVSVGSEEYSDVWRDLWNAANYFNDKQFANQVALRHLLDRKLLKYAYDNGFEDRTEWDGYSVHYFICYNCYVHEIAVDVTAACKEQVIYFSSKEAAELAIEEAVKPFMKEHPGFVW